MKRQVRIRAGTVTALAELDETGTADAIWGLLPIRGEAQTWGEEIYFDIPLKMGQEDGRELVNPGDLGYWPEGPALCIFCGPTPISGKGEVRAASAVNIFGRLTGDPRVFRMVKDGDKIVMEKA